MELKFWKYHGLGNDFVIVRGRDLEAAGVFDAGDLAKRICARHTGVGADGLLIARGASQGEPEPLEMVIFNSDGSRASMCGNGIRCFAAWCRDESVRAEDVYPVLTDAGERVVAVLAADPFRCEIEMGAPDFSPAAAGIADTQDADFLGKKVLLADGQEIVVSSLFMGTYHTVVWLDRDGNREAGAPSIDDEAALERFGSELHVLPVFTKQTNVNMAMLEGTGPIRLRTFERGAGMTLACGTGACACAAVAWRTGLIPAKNDTVRIRLPLGELRIRRDAERTIYMAGPAECIAEGLYKI